MTSHRDDFDSRFPEDPWVTEFVYPPKGLTDKPRAGIRPLPADFAHEARRYIVVVCKRYSPEKKSLFGFPMWFRFCDVWNDTGDIKKAMRVI